MGFKKRIWISYIVLLMVISLVGGFAVISLLMKQYQREEFTVMETIGTQTVSQLDSQLRIMNVAMDNVLSDRDVINSIVYLSLNEEQTLYRAKYLSSLNTILNQWFYAKNFYRVLYYNDAGDRAATYNFGRRVIDTELMPSELPWLPQVRERKGSPKLIAPREDEWGARESVRVLSLVKEIQGTDMGFLEVQVRQEQIEKIFAEIADNYNVYVYYEDDTLIYPSQGDAEEWKSLCSDEKTGARICTNPLSGEKAYVYVGSLSEYGLRIVLTGSTSIVWQKAQYYVAMTIVSILLLLTVFFVYVSIMTNQLSKPIIQLRQQIEEMNYLGEDGHFYLDEKADELGSFSDAFNQMVNTINELLLKDMEAEIQIQRSRAEKREMELLYLRNQINPHFLYNTLDTIRIKAVLGKNEDVAHMIELLILFFRNGLEHSEQIVRIEHEIEMIRAYAGIMSCRYPGIETIFELDSQFMEAAIPGFVLQPLMENCFLHGLKERCYQGSISVKLYRKDKECLCIAIHNDGDPLTEEDINRLCDCAQGKLGNAEGPVRRRHVGLSNIASRLRLYYPDERCGLFFEAAEEGGLNVEVVILESYEISESKGE